MPDTAHERRRSRRSYSAQIDKQIVRRGEKAVTVLLTTLGTFVGLVLLVWLGLQINPPAFPAYPQATAVKTVPLPTDLPAPVERFYRSLYGDQLPVIDTAVVSGRASMCVMGVRFPARFRFTHEAGQNYRHYLELTLFGYPIMRINETYLDGNGRLELPFGVTENEPKVDQGANLGLWAEAVWFPALFVTDERVSWEAVDDTTALLKVPFGNRSERFVARFDPETGLLDLLESMRYKGAEGDKVLWLNHVLEWNTLNGYTQPVKTSLSWFDEGSPWAVWITEDVVYNSDVGDYVRAKGL